MVSDKKPDVELHCVMSVEVVRGALLVFVSLARFLCVNWFPLHMNWL